MDVFLEIGGSITCFVVCELLGSSPSAAIASEILGLKSILYVLLNLNPKIQQMLEDKINHVSRRVAVEYLPHVLALR